MWVCLNNAFFSIVASDKDPALLVVRARRSGDIEAYFPDHEVHELANADYAFRAFVPRREVANMLAFTAWQTRYTNFKDSVADDDLHDAYQRVWAIMVELQNRLRRTLTKPR